MVKSYDFIKVAFYAVWRKCNFVIIVCLVCLHKVMFFFILDYLPSCTEDIDF